MNFIKKIFGFLREREKESTISRSGSIEGNTREKIRSGQSYLYKKFGMESEVIEIRFVHKVRGYILNRALTESVKRYPYFNTKLVEKEGDFYIVRNDNAMIAKKTDRLFKLGGIACGYHLVDVTYFEKSAFVSFHHALCDGRGIKPFVETLLWYYGKFRYKNAEKIQGIRLAGDPMLEGETVDPFLQTYEYDGEKEYPAFRRDAFSLPEDCPAEGTLNYRYEVVVKTSHLMTICKENNATPVIFAALLMSGVIADLYPDSQLINANIATDMREALGCENTFKNCVKSMILPYDRELASLPFAEQGARYRALLSAQRDKDYCRKEASAMMGLFEKLDGLKGFDKKLCPFSRVCP